MMTIMIIIKVTIKTMIIIVVVIMIINIIMVQLDLNENRHIFTVPKKGYAKRGSNRQIATNAFLSHF